MIYIRRFPTTAIACAVCSIKRNFQEEKNKNKHQLFHFEGGKNVCCLCTMPGIKMSTWLKYVSDGFIWVATPVGFNCLGPLYS